jgi:hypothetical protein
MKFDDIDIDPTQYELRRGGELVSVEPKVFDLINFLASNANRLITKDELIEEIWDGRIVSDAALSTAIKSARRAMGETEVREGRSNHWQKSCSPGCSACWCVIWTALCNCAKLRQLCLPPGSN